MNEKHSRLTSLMMDLRDCLTVIKGILETSCDNRQSDSYKVIMENIQIADSKLSEYLKMPELRLICSTKSNSMDKTNFK